MTQNNVHDKDVIKEQIAAPARRLARPYIEDNNIENPSTENGNVKISSPRRFSNIKSRIIGFIGAVLIGLMVYNLLVNYLGLA